MKIKKILLISFVTFLILFAVIGTYTFRNLGNWLIVSDPLPDSLDVIVSLTGYADRYDYAKELAKKYHNAYWFISIGVVPIYDTITLSTVIHKDLVREGFAPNRLLVNDTCTTTWAEVNLFNDLIDTIYARKNADPSFKPRRLTAAFVSSPYHTRRIMLQARRFVDLSRVDLLSLPVPIEKCTRPPHPKNWWKYEDDAEFILMEMIKMPYYYIKYRKQ